MLMDFQTIQKQFADHIRNPAKNTGPENIEARRLKIYSDLFYNNVESFIARAFPVLRKIHTDAQWHNMVKDFFEKHHSQSPYFLHIAQEFLTYLEIERDSSDDFPFLLELAHYEWVELALDVSQDEIPDSDFETPGNLLVKPIVFSPLAWLLQYQWPVHKIGPEFIPQQTESNQQITFLIVYRNADFQIKFMELNALSARLISILQDHEQLNGTQAIEQLFQELPESLKSLTLESLLNNASKTLEHLRSLGIILGTRP